ncbi:abnormal spindle-like microcephaly-associated protein homolog isoform X2 [Tripterygium wilfordii]|uniref:abnormal spindle-like microcephaly-associated protein homolog isoform X2 n=1 Tax=Tripterygium wilfordii TaxID=458696 RepID=UPI0018F820CF|nr:abnormal spindle-like microcephaly-associated protein homolog isoform X2 [Tripterygium wilfordii]
MDVNHHPCPSPSPYLPCSSSASLLKDISNFKTPKRPSQASKLTSPSSQFFTASKQTPRSTSSSFRRGRPSLAPSSSRHKTAAARRIKAFELEQSKSSRKAQIVKEQSLKSLSKSLTVWLNFLLENPRSCGCDLTVDCDRNVGKGKREGGLGGELEVGVDVAWRNPKRQRDLTWRGDDAGSREGFSNSIYLPLKNSLKDVCSFDDLTERMQVYLSLRSCKEILDVMTRVAKNIDEGRLKMKSHCPIVTDFGMKEKATKILMSYNPIWLRIGLYIIFGGASLLIDGDDKSDEAITFLKMIIERQLFSHSGLAKAYAYNKKVEGLYRPGYYEILGDIILKRILMLVLTLDRAKCQSSLPVKFGIDGVDGGSPLLFTLQSGIKSSCQVIHDLLSSDVMHGEGNLLAHLVIIGYEVSHEQCPLVEYDFTVTDLFVDLQDGIRLCRAIQLLLHDQSIFPKLVVPSDSRKKNLANCGIALQCLKQVGATIFDEDGVMIMAEDIVNGDKELTLSLLWNVFVHLQLPLLINKTILAEEILKIQGFNVDPLDSSSSTSLDMLLNWIRAICEKYDFKIDNFSSLVDGKAIWCLLDFYFRKELFCSCSLKDTYDMKGEKSIMSDADYTDAVHNYMLSQKLASLSGNFPEVMQISDLLEHNGAVSDRSIVLLLVFLASQLIVKKSVLNFHKLLGCDCQSPDSRKHLSTGRWFVNSEPRVEQENTDGFSSEDAARRFKAIQAWWQDMADQNYKCVVKPAVSVLQSSNRKSVADIIQRENAAKTIQSMFRQLTVRRKFLKTMSAVYYLQTVFRACLMVKQKAFCNKIRAFSVQEFSCERGKFPETFGRYVQYIVDRRSFVELKRSVLVIQRAARIWISRTHGARSTITYNVSSADPVNAGNATQKYIHGLASRSIHVGVASRVEQVSLMRQPKVPSDLEIGAAVKIQNFWKYHIYHKSLNYRHLAATKIQSHFRGWLWRRRFLTQGREFSIVKIQSAFRGLRGWRAYQQHKNASNSVVVIQSHIRGWSARRDARRNMYLWKNHIDHKSLNYQHAATKIQSHFRGWLWRRRFLTREFSIVKIQSAFRGFRCWRAYQLHKNASNSVIVIQSHIRGWSARRVAQRNMYLVSIIQRCWRSRLIRREFLLQREAAIKIQSNIRRLRCWQIFRSHQQAAIRIQQFVRGHITRKRLLGASSFWVATPSHRKLQYNKSRVFYQSSAIKAVLCSVLKLQRWWKAVLLLKLQSAVIIQSHFRGWITRQKFNQRKAILLLKLQSAVIIQSHFRGWISRQNFNRMKAVLLLKLQSAVIIQSHFRGWITRQKFNRRRLHVVIIQSYWRGYLARKESSRHLLDLRLRVQKSAINVDDSMRIINRLIHALKELQSIKSVSGVLHICTTLDMTTGYSEKCCEELVAAGAVETLLKLIRSVSRSIPDQEVLKHALSTLRNLARFTHLTEVLIDSRGSVEIILWEFLRNKDAYFIAHEILKKICSNHKGVEALRKSPSLLKRLHSLVDELTRKANIEKRKARGVAARDNTERRLRAAVELLQLATGSS